MPVAEKGSSSMAREGRHILKLVKVEEDRVPSQYSKDADGKAAVWYWHFDSTFKGEGGIPEAIRHMTNAELTPNNNQRKFWGQLLPGVAFEELSGDTADVEGCLFEAEIVHQTKGDKTYANIAFIKPYKPTKKTAAPAPPPPPTDDEEAVDDPFAKDN